MKITKDEKQLYKLLDIVSKIFGRATNKTFIIGEDRKLYFYTLGYCGVYISHDDNQHLINAYDFNFHQYQLKQLPSKEYVLDRANDETIKENIKYFIDIRRTHNKWQLEMYKDYPCKAAKIAVHTNKWLKDDDIALLKAFLEYDVLLGEDCLIFKYSSEICTIYIMFMDSVVAPDADDATQLKNYINNELGNFEKPINRFFEEPEEFEDDNQEELEEDEEDPMA